MDKQKARVLRRNMTDAEKVLWRHLRLRQVDGHKFRRQHPIGDYIVDFVCLEKRLVIEVDGGQHAESMMYDRERSSWLEARGYMTLRFWNNQVIHEAQAVLEAIRQALLKR
ncbi:MAG: endonuclease domain-containing protein [Deltaproteobacteria bacterium]|nr:endonuclease domain-containing protein [Deltaproteobacteria bacterium]